MRGLVVIGSVSVCGCTTVFGLDEPARVPIDAAVAIDAAVTIDAMPDAPPPPCPSAYTATVPSSTSRYRIIIQSATFNAQHQICKADQTGRTHLASLDSLAEINELRAMVGTSTVYIGGVQAPDQAAPDQNWITFNGGPVPVAGWSTAPNDGDGVEDNLQNVAVITSTGLGDRLHTDLHLGLCECDGIAVSQVAEDYIPAP